MIAVKLFYIYVNIYFVHLQCIKGDLFGFIVVHTIYLINIYLWKSSTEPEAHHRKRKRDFLQNSGEFVPKRTLAVKMAASITVP